MKRLIALLSALLAGGCATWGSTWSEISGYRYYNTTTLNRRPAIIEKVVGYSSYPSYPIKLEPGQHAIELGGPAPRWPGGAALHTLNLDLEPCKRYYLNAQFENPVDPTWKPVVDYVESIPGCRTNTASK
jgi:hypothetical protein